MKGGRVMRRSCLAFWIAALMLIFGVAAVQAADKAEKNGDSSKSTIAVFRLAGSITEAPPDETLFFASSKAVSLKDLVTRIKQATKDDAVKAVVILHEAGSMGQAQREELRQAIANLRTAGKDVYAHADSLSM